MEEIGNLIKRVESEINKTPTGKLRNLLCDVNIVLQYEQLDTNDFVHKFDKYQDAYEDFLRWCLDNNGKMPMSEWTAKKAKEFKKRGLDNFFNDLVINL